MNFDTPTPRVKPVSRIRIMGKIKSTWFVCVFSPAMFVVFVLLFEKLAYPSSARQQVTAIDRPK